MELTRAERWILANQFRILERLYPDDAEHYARNRQVVEQGFELDYEWLSEHVYDRTMSASECSEVLDILDMHSALARSYEELSDKPAGIDKHDVAFWGFDGNHETAQIAYTGFLIKEEGKFEDLAQSGDHLNSHMPVLDMYRRMVGVWKQLPVLTQQQLSPDDIRRIAAARSAPAMTDPPTRVPG